MSKKLYEKLTRLDGAIDEKLGSAFGIEGMRSAAETAARAQKAIEAIYEDKSLSEPLKKVRASKLARVARDRIEDVLGKELQALERRMEDADAARPSKLLRRQYEPGDHLVIEAAKIVEKVGPANVHRLSPKMQCAVLKAVDAGLAPKAAERTIDLMGGGWKNADEIEKARRGIAAVSKIIADVNRVVETNFGKRELQKAEAKLKTMDPFGTGAA